MPSFSKGPNYRTPFGKNVYLGSTVGNQFESYTLAAATIDAVTIDDADDQKIVKPGTLMAKITSGTHSGKVGPFDDNASDGRQTEANIVGFCDTFLPWQTMERDVEIAVLYKGTVVSSRCFEYESGAEVALTSATVTKCKTYLPHVAFRTLSTEV